MKEYCAKRRSETQWEKVFKARDIETAAKIFVRGNSLIQPLDEILVVENVAFGDSEKASFLAHELEMRAGWTEVLESRHQQDGADTSSCQEKENFENKEEVYQSEALKYITKIREESGYWLLRNVVSNVSTLLYIVIFAGCCFTLARVDDAFGTSGWMFLEVIKDCVVNLLVVFVVSKISIVLIDIADLLIEQNRNHKKQ